MAELNPIIQPNINLERPIVKPESTVNIAGALAPLVGIAADAFGVGEQTTATPTAGEKKDAALRGYFQKINDWQNSDMAPQDFQANVRGLALAQLEATPQYRTDIMGGLEIAGVSAPVQPDSLDDAYNAEWNSWLQSNEGVTAMIASAQFTGGGLDDPATMLEVQRRFQQSKADAAAAESRAAKLARLEYDEKMYNAEVKSVVRTIAPQWNIKSNDTLRGLFTAAAQGDPLYDDPMEQIQAITQFRMMTEMQIRDSALANGITDPSVYEAELKQALAPFDAVLNAVKNNSEAASALVTAYSKANELNSAEMFMEALGPMFGGQPAAIEAFSNLMVNGMYNSPEDMQGALEYARAAAERGGDTMPSVFPNMPIDPSKAVSTEVKPELPEFSDMDDDEILGTILNGSKMIMTQETAGEGTLMGLVSVVAASNAYDGGPLDSAVIRSVLNPTNIRMVSQLTGADREEAEALLSNFSGEQIRRNLILANNLAEGSAYSVGQGKDGKFVVMIDGKETMKPENATGTRADLWTAVDNLNTINSLVGRIKGVSEPVGEYTKSMVMGEEPTFDSGDIETFLDRQPTEAVVDGAGDAEIKGGAGEDVLADPNAVLTGFTPITPEQAQQAEDHAHETQAAVGTSVVPDYGYQADPTFESRVVNGRSSPHWNTAVETARKYGIPEQILTRLITAESDWRADLGENSAGAAGLAQFLEGTAAEYGIDRMDPNQAIDGAARYLDKMYKKYGRWDLALAAYNAGPGNVDKHGGVPPFAETQNYVSKILGGVGGQAGMGYSEYRTGDGVPVDYTPAPLPTNINVRDGVLYDSMEGASHLTHAHAVDNMNFILNGPFQQMQAMFGAPLTINDAIAKAGTSREQNTKGSQHFHGNALDISIAGISNEEKLRVFQSALAAGFTGFGFGDGILHIDIGPKRSWAYGNTTFGGLPLAEVQAMVSGSSNTQLDPGSPTTNDRLILPSNYNQGVDAEVNQWIPDADPDEGEVTGFAAVQQGDASGVDEEAAAIQAQEAESAINIEGQGQQQGGTTKASASQGATTELTNRMKAVLQEFGASPADLQQILKMLEEEGAG